MWTTVHPQNMNRFLGWKSQILTFFQYINSHSKVSNWAIHTKLHIKLYLPKLFLYRSTMVTLTLYLISGKRNIGWISGFLVFMYWHLSQNCCLEHFKIWWECQPCNVDYSPSINRNCFDKKQPFWVKKSKFDIFQYTNSHSKVNNLAMYSKLHTKLHLPTLLI